MDAQKNTRSPMARRAGKAETAVYKAQHFRSHSTTTAAGRQGGDGFAR